MRDTRTNNPEPSDKNDNASRIKDLPQKPVPDGVAETVKGGDQKTGVANITKKGN